MLCGWRILFEMAHREWLWRLDDGTRVRAELDLSSRVESVYVGPRLVSRRAAAAALGDGHVIDLGATGGVYRGPGEARVAFDTFEGGLASCTLTIAGNVIQPKRAPRPVRTFALPAIVAALAYVIAYRGARVLPDIVAATGSTVSTATTRADVPPGPTRTPAEQNERIAAGLDFRQCQLRARADGKSEHGELAVETTIDETGKVVATRPTGRKGTISPDSERCIMNIVTYTRFVAGTPQVLRIPVIFELPP